MTKYNASKEHTGVIPLYEKEARERGRVLHLPLHMLPSSLVDIMSLTHMLHFFEHAEVHLPNLNHRHC